MIEFPMETNSWFLTTLEGCRRRNHPIVACGTVEFCLVCHFRTDQSFVWWSREVLASAKARLTLAQLKLKAA